ncbi:MAG: DUF2807 domain-containing protein [Thermoflexibacter sp.]|jgi:hypothetical protein|nr:DUF2807 domain-containing protein [Thermoflexibacter sp.]
MKTKVLFFLLLIAYKFPTFAQNAEERSIGEFDRIDVSGHFDIYLRKGDKPSLKVEARRLDLDEIITKVNGSTLRIECTRRNMRDGEKGIIYITFTNLKEIDASGAGNIIGESVISGERFEAEMSGAGNLEFEVDVQNLELELSGAGNIEVSGKAKDLEVSISGAGSFRGFKLKTEDAEIRMSGVGKAEVYASEFLDAETSGVGSIRYRGEPKKVRAKAGFLGSVKPD